MPVKILQKTLSAYAYPLLIKNLLQSNTTPSAEQEIVSSDHYHSNSQTLSRRVVKPANLLGDIGCKQGNAGRGHGLGQSSISGMLFCCSRAGCDP